MLENEKLTVCLFTFNHKNYIKKAIESVLMQKINFSFKLIIADDCSSDGTYEICKSYQIDNQEKIILLRKEKNVGMRENIVGTLLEVKSEFIALIEGDDFWIDPLKLEKQLYFLENNPKFSMCFHQAIRMDERQNYKLLKLSLFPNIVKSKVVLFQELINKWIVPTASIMFNNRKIAFPEFSIEIYNWDWLLNLLGAHYGKVYYLSEVMSVYRMNDSGNISNPFFDTKNTIIRQIDLLHKFNMYSKYRYSYNIEYKVSSLKKQLRKLNSPLYIVRQGLIKHLKTAIKKTLSSLSFTFLSFTFLSIIVIFDNYKIW